MRLDLRYITRRYFHDFDDIAVINDGWCFVWAWMAKLHHPHARLATLSEAITQRAHAFVWIGDLAYDAERPRGDVAAVQRGAWRVAHAGTAHSARHTVAPPTNTGSRTANGVRTPVRPTDTSMLRSLVTACSAGNFRATPQRGARDTKPSLCCQSRRSTL